MTTSAAGARSYSISRWLLVTAAIGLTVTTHGGTEAVSDNTLVSTFAPVVTAAQSSSPPATLAEDEERPEMVPATDGSTVDRVQTSSHSQDAADMVLNSGTPVFEGDFADPFLLSVDDGLYAYATNTRDANVPVLYADSSSDGEYLGDALPDLPHWTNSLWNWAPAVAEVDGTFVLYYTTRHVESGRMCISVAVADDPAGPFVDDSAEPLICDLEQGGSIDPSPFIDTDQSRWLLWKSDGNCCGISTKIYAQRLTDDGTGLAGEPTELIRNDLGWESDVVEGPSMIEIDGTYHLFYSANRWDTADYAVGHAICASVTGPCTKDSEPWLSSQTLGSSDGVLGPGGLEVVDLAHPFADLVLYHAWTGGAVGYETSVRALFAEPIVWADGEPLRASSLRIDPNSADLDIAD